MDAIAPSKVYTRSSFFFKPQTSPLMLHLRVFFFFELLDADRSVPWAHAHDSRE